MFSTEPLRCSRLTVDPTCSRIDGVSGIEAFGGDDPARDLIRAQQLARCGSEHANAEPREFISREIAIAAIGALRSDRLRVKIGR
jgi:hypothetical protein